MQNMTQFLYIIRDMASSDDERNQRNAKILQTNVFHKELIPVACFAFQQFNKTNLSDILLYDTVDFRHILLMAYSNAHDPDREYESGSN